MAILKDMVVVLVAAIMVVELVEHVLEEETIAHQEGAHLLSRV
jgi:hypothetical protein